MNISKTLKTLFNVYSVFITDIKYLVSWTIWEIVFALLIYIAFLFSFIYASSNGIKEGNQCAEMGKYIIFSETNGFSICLLWRIPERSGSNNEWAT